MQKTVETECLVSIRCDKPDCDASCLFGAQLIVTVLIQSQCEGDEINHGKSKSNEVSIRSDKGASYLLSYSF